MTSGPSARLGALSPSTARDAVEWHSAIAERFDAGYARSSAFKERLRIWSGLIDRHAPRDGQVLDAGCGSGIMATIAASRARRVVGFDASAEMIRIARTRRQSLGASNIEFRSGAVGDASVIAGGPFDLVLCSSVLEYVENYWQAFDWLLTATAPEGVLVFSLPSGGSLYRRVERGVFAITGKPAFLAHVRNSPRRAEVVRGLAERGLEILFIRSYGLPAGIAGPVRALRLETAVAPLFVIACRRGRINRAAA